MADTVDSSSKFVADAAVGFRVIFLEPMITVAFDSADQRVCKFSEDNALIFRFVDHACSLEYLFFGPIKASILEVLNLEVVITSPNGVHGSERHIFIRPAITCEIVIKRTDVWV